MMGTPCESVDRFHRGECVDCFDRGLVHPLLAVHPCDLFVGHDQQAARVGPRHVLGGVDVVERQCLLLDRREHRRQRLGGTLEFDRKTNRFTNSRIGNELLVGAPPRKGWEQYYQV